MVLVLLLFPVAVLMSGALASALLGESLYRNGRSTHAGSELVEIQD